jgi:hypothetical protein
VRCGPAACGARRECDRETARACVRAAAKDGKGMALRVFRAVYI